MKEEKSRQIYVVKRDKRLEAFSEEKLYKSIVNAVKGAGLTEEDADRVFVSVISNIRSINAESIESAKIADIVEKSIIEKIVENPLYEEAAKRFVLARIYNHVFGKNSWKEFDSIDLKLTFNSLKVLESRYLLRDPETLRYRETPHMMFKRVAKHLASVEKRYGAGEDKVKSIEREFLRLLVDLRFMPNSPTLMNAGTRLGVLSACFVIPVRDAMTTPDGEGIMDAARAMALIHQQGGGTGFDFSELRPEGDIVASTAGVASGPLSFMRIYDTITDVVKQGGKRRGANMGIMHIWHPDIEKFIKSKTGELKDVHLQNFNISVGIYDAFMESALSAGKWFLVNPRQTFLGGENQAYDSRLYAMSRARHTFSEDWVAEYVIEELEENGGSIPLDKTLIITLEEALEIAKNEDAVVKIVNSAELLKEIAHGAWDSGDPGLVFIDEINRRHPTWYLGKINATNPCGEEPLLPWENCNLGSINLEKYVVERNGKLSIDWSGLARDVRFAVRFLDNVIDANKHPLPQIDRANKFTRKIGLGVMGWARLLARLGIPYDSPDAVLLAWSLGEWITYNAYKASVELAKEKGVFPAWNPKLYRFVWRTRRFEKPEDLMKEAGIEKIEYSQETLRIVNERPRVDWAGLEEEIKENGLRNAALLSIAPTGSISIVAGTSSSIEPFFALAYVRVVSVGTFIEVDKLFLEYLKKYELDEPDVIKEIAKTGMIGHIPFMPRSLKKLFKTAHEIEPKWHIIHQAAWQQWIDAAVSKTINLRHNESVKTVWESFILAWKLGCKGITIYRDRSKSQQVIYVGIKSKEELTSERKEKTEEFIDKIPEALDKQVASREARDQRETRITPKKLRIGKEELVAVTQEYSGGCPTCDI